MHNLHCHLFICFFILIFVSLTFGLECRATIARAGYHYKRMVIINKQCEYRVKKCATMEILIRNRTYVFPQCEGDRIKGHHKIVAICSRNSTDCITRSINGLWTRTCCCNTNLCNTNDLYLRRGYDTKYFVIFCVSCVIVALILRLSCYLPGCRKAEIPHRSLSIDSSTV
ncbi:hypothetical protein AB6A40_009901 [Gnathostoma spinigerum]|uniref:Uncharacterized protein n=1 Tax=Gnathostoma spinigerum TaxID=75299 RepID=A0ABD6F1G9_9BILA